MILRYWASRLLATTTGPGRASSRRALSCSASRLDIFNVQDEEDFKRRVLESKTPTVVDFHAEWCGPCKMLGPQLEKAVSALDGQVNMAKVNIDDLGEIAMDYDVKAVPTVVGIKAGKKVGNFVGMKDPEEIESFVKKLSSP